MAEVRVFRQCGAGYHRECSDRQGIECGCICHDRTLFRTTYRSVDEAGKLWAESSSLDEVQDLSPGMEIQVCYTYLVTDGWEAYPPPYPPE